MDSAATIRGARGRAGLTQTELARRAGTSQATISAYEHGRKVPSVETLDRLLAATGTRLTTVPASAPVVRPTRAQLARAGRRARGRDAAGGGAAYSAFALSCASRP